MPLLSELPETTNLKILLFGDPGTGKTTLAASAHLIEELRPVLYATAEGGLVVLQKDPQHRYDDLTVHKLTTPEQDPSKVLDELEKVFEIAQNGHFRTVVIDTLSEVQRYGLSYLSEQPTQLWQAIRKPKKVTIPIYGASMMQTSVLLRAFRDLPINVIMTTHVKRATFEVDGHDYIVPSLTGQQWKDAVAIFDEVLFLFTKAAQSLRDPNKGVKYKAITKAFENIKAKDRYLNLPVSMDLTNKTLEELFAYIPSQE